jgi:hypothetical protein
MDGITTSYLKNTVINLWNVILQPTTDISEIRFCCLAFVIGLEVYVLVFQIQVHRYKGNRIMDAVLHTIRNCIIACISIIVYRIENPLQAKLADVDEQCKYNALDDESSVPLVNRYN